MDCLEFRRILTATPHSDDPAFIAHRRECASCAAAWERAQAFENELMQALNMPAPEGLTDRILLAQTTGRRQRISRGRRIALSLAASVLVALGVGGVVWQQVDAHSLPALAVAHMPPEIESLNLTEPLTTQAVAAGFAGRNLALRGPVPTGTTYVHDCEVGRYKAVHLVTRRDGEPVVVLYMPDKRVAKTRDFDRHGWVGREMPMGTGSLVLLTNRGTRAPFDAVAADWRKAIQGPGADAGHAPLAP
ncbi:hypothetical protein GCM10027285_01550 [Oleiagrimonas citrea]|uniref:DUF3379 domain-containing protein n=1 Tax=Oleiagrimonas citrea TaxID=1665687 RepID=A0A846ZPE3_9GAMM|nr:DUF3379 family protein [Oleiagrimonas citrea]NKZ39906.1 DUF3379 domain-containing protein [Oleiagrimonas citrea]